MITRIDDAIRQLQAIRAFHGNLLVADTARDALHIENMGFEVIETKDWTAYMEEVDGKYLETEPYVVSFLPRQEWI